MNKKYIFLVLSVFFGSLFLKAQNETNLRMALTPYIVNDASTPTADKILLDKLKQIVIKYGVGSNDGLQSPFIITGHAIELNQATTATAPSNIAVDLSLTLYIGNGEEGVEFSSCNFNLRGAGKNIDQAYASAFRHLNINDENLKDAIEDGKKKISQYYASKGKLLINKANIYAASGNYPEAYNLLLTIPPVCPQYNEAQNLIIELVTREYDARNSAVISRARAAWSAHPNSQGAHEAERILGELENVSPQLRKSADDLMQDMASHITKVNEDMRQEAKLREVNSHAERMAIINTAMKIAETQAQRPVYNVQWW